MAKKLSVKLVRSVISQKEKIRKNLLALGLGTKIGRVKVHNDTPVIRGMIAKTSHLVEVEEVDA